MRSRACLRIDHDRRGVLLGPELLRGKLGDGTETHRDLPTRVAGLSDVAEIGAAGDRTCARTRGGDVYCWGDSEFGKAGDGRLPDNSGREKLRPGAAILSGATSLAVGSVHACSLLKDGRLSCWGQNLSGATGQPLTTRNVGRPKVATNVSSVASIYAGSGVACAIAGQLGDGTKKDRAIPAAVTGLPANVRVQRIAAEGARVCALLADGRVFCWGKDLPNDDSRAVEIRVEK